MVSLQLEAAPMTETASVVALRSADPGLVEEVRSILETASIHLLICAPGSDAPSAAGVLLDSAAEATSADPSWIRVGGAAVSVARDEGVGADLVVPREAERLLALARLGSRRRYARVVGVVGARGGIGASVFAATLARTATSLGLGVSLLDMSPGGGLDLLIGAEGQAGLRWGDLTDVEGGLDGVELLESLPRWQGVRVLSHDLRGRAPTEVHVEVLAAASSATDLVVADLERGQDLPELVRWCDDVVVVAGTDVLSVAATQALRPQLFATRARLIVRETGARSVAATEIASACGLELLATLGTERSLPGALERGLGPGAGRRGPLRRTATAVLKALDVR